MYVYPCCPPEMIFVAALLDAISLSIAHLAAGTSVIETGGVADR
jgi:hypothetical protein